MAPFSLIVFSAVVSIAVSGAKQLHSRLKTGPQAKTISELEKGVNNLSKSASFEEERSNAHRLGKQNVNG